MEELIYKTKKAVSNTPGQANEATAFGPKNNTGYARYLAGYDLEFITASPYLITGNRPFSNGWLIHVSVVRQQMDLLMESITDFLCKNGCAFCIPLNVEKHNEILDGRCGPNLTGRVVSIQAGTGLPVNELVYALKVLTKGLKGPDIPGCARLAPGLFVAYGCLFSEIKIKTKKDLARILTASHVKWPFKGSAIHIRTPRKFLQHKYIKIQSLKNDAKGDVFKVVKLNRVFNMELCILKQGLRFQCFDDSGRDIRARLSWQFELHRALKDVVPVPGVHDCFEMDGDGYLVMDFIDGVSLSEFIIAGFSGTTWPYIADHSRVNLLNYLRQLLCIVKKVHLEGYIHRDLNPENFLVRKDGKLFLTDFELCCSARFDYPSPAFALGTNGYLSPQQRALCKPAASDDIFSISGILIKFFTGLSPLKFNLNDSGALFAQLRYFTGNEPLCHLIVSCRDQIPGNRPGLDTLVKAAESIYTELTGPGLRQMQIAGTLTTEPVTDELVIQTGRKSIRALFGLIPENPAIASEGPLNVTNGLAGCLYTLAQYKKAGVPLDEFRLQQDLIYSILTSSLKGTEDPLSGIEGPCGNLLAIAAYETQSLAGPRRTVSAAVPGSAAIEKSLHFNLANGLSGAGLLLLKDPGIFTLGNGMVLDRIADRLIACQGADGSWSIRPPGKSSPE